MLSLAIDIGGSSIKSALCTSDDGLVKMLSVREPVPVRSRDFASLRSMVMDIVDDVLREQKIQALGISTTGAVDRSGRVLSAGHFVGYEDVSWADILMAAFPSLTRVVTINDGKASTWAEYRGTGRPSEVFAHFVVGTGVGGGLVCCDALVYGDGETAGALGHMKVALDSDVICSCGRTGCVETVASAPAIVRLFAGGEGRGDATGFDDVVNAARNGDPAALVAFDSAGRWLGVAISNVINVLNPRFITVGGGVLVASQAIDPVGGGPYLRAAVQRARELAFEDVAEATTIIPSRYGNDGGIIGAALMALRVA